MAVASSVAHQQHSQPRVLSETNVVRDDCWASWVHTEHPPAVGSDGVAGVWAVLCVGVEAVTEERVAGSRVGVFDDADAGHTVHKQSGS